MNLIKYHIAIAPDNKYANAALTMLNSLFINNPKIKIYVHILDGGIDLKNKIKYFLFFTKRRIKYKFYKIDYSRIPNAILSNHISKSAYNRIFMSSILKVEIEKVLYLDCDIIIKNSIVELLDTNIDEYYLAGVTEKPTEAVIQNLQLNKSKYFNSGVLLINLKKWRSEYFEQKLVNFTNNFRDKIIFHDQDVLNFCAKNNWLSLNYKYNVTHFFYHPESYSFEYFGLTESEYLEIKSNPVILHFTSHQKPWIEGCKHPKKDLYFQYELTFKKILFG
jgi:lipopolysaccharide biosynthesis glycosyltransferase